MDLHRSIGLTILALTAARLALRVVRGVPRIRDGVPGWQKLTAQSVHAGFYLVLFAAPIVGWLYTNAVGQEVTFFWLVRLPNLIDATRALAISCRSRTSRLRLALVFSCRRSHGGGALQPIHSEESHLRQDAFAARRRPGLGADFDLGQAAPGRGGVALRWRFPSVSRGFGHADARYARPRLYDGVLQSTSYVRSSQLSFERFVGNAHHCTGRADDPKADSKKTTAAAFEEIKKALEQIQSDLDVALERVADPAIIASAKKIRAKVGGLTIPVEAWWSARVENPPADLVAKFDGIRGDIEYLVQDVAALGFTKRSEMEGEASYANDVMLITMLAALIAAAVIIVLTAGTVSRQVYQASAVARRIAGGDYDTQLSVSGKTEMAKLLGSLEEMRLSIKTHLQRLVGAKKEAEEASSSNRSSSRI